MTINRSGVTRIVFLFETVVIKIPKPRIWNHFLRGIIANINERDTYRYSSGKYEKGQSYLLCPVIWCSWGGWVLVMKKAKQLTEKEFSEHSFGEHLQWYRGDDTISNYGMLEGKIVKIDYGDLDHFWGSDLKKANFKYSG